MKFLIIGASGMVGSATFRTLKSMGHRVVGTESKARTSGLEHFDLFSDNIPAKVDYLLDLLSFDDCGINSEDREYGKISVVIFAFVTQIDKCFLEKERSYVINVTKMKELLSYLDTKNSISKKVKIIFISSSFVFDGSEGYYTEEHPLNPICEYGRHKAEVEKYISENIPEALVLRLDKIVGDDPRKEHLFSGWYILLQQKREINCIEKQLLSPTYVQDIAKAVVLACKNNLSGVFHAANQEFFTREELANQFINFSGGKTGIVTTSQEELGSRNFRPLKTYLDSTKFIEATGIRFTPMKKVFELFFRKVREPHWKSEIIDAVTELEKDTSMIEHKPHTLIIGGTKGIGRAIAKTLAGRGHCVSVLGRSKPSSQIEFVDTWQADLEHPHNCLKVIDEIIAKNGAVTNLVSAQRYRGEDDWNKEITVDVTATKIIIENLKNRFDQTHQNAVIIISSIASIYIAEEQNVNYHLAKAALNQLVKYYAIALGSQGIRVNGVLPGTTIKEESKDFYTRNPELCELYKNITPLRRMGTAEDIAHTVAFLCSDDASFITGQNIIVDGGVSLQSHESLARQLTPLHNTKVTQSNKVQSQTKCRLCKNENMLLVVKLASTPIGDAYLPTKQELRHYPLDLYLCESCGLLQILSLVNPELVYRDYIYHTADSLGLVEHFRKYVESALTRINPALNSLVVEIGSNDGSALQFYKNAGLRVLGIDPAREIAEHATMRGIKTLPEFFNAALARKIVAEESKASIIMANNVLANIDDLTDIIGGIKILLAPDGMLIFETGYALDLIQKKILDNIYHEHLSYFSIKPLQYFFRQHGLQLIHVERVPTKGGSIRCTVQFVNGPRMEHPSVAELIKLEELIGIHSINTLKQFAAQIQEMKIQLTTLLQDLKAQGKKIAGYGASVGVTTLLYALGLREFIDFLADDNINRQNRYSPGLQIPVRSPDSICDTDYVLILAWQYADPIMKKHQKYLEQGGKIILFLPHISIISEREG